MKYYCLFLVFLFTNALNQALPQNAEVLNKKIEVVYDGLKLIQTTSIILRINNREGLDYAYLSIPANSITKVEEIQGAAYNSSGKQIKKLKKKDIVFRSDISESAFYEDDYEYAFEMIHNEFPYTINYSFVSEKTDFVNLVSWYPFYYWYIPTRKAELSVVVPKNYAIKIKENLLKYTLSELDEKTLEYKWSAIDIMPTASELHMPSNESVYPYVRIIPLNFHYKVPGSHKNWKSYGQFISDLNTGITDLPGFEKAKIDDITKGINEKKALLDILYKYVQDETRYVDISLEFGGLESHSAAYVSENKYGDCKALSTYLKALLEYVGINSYYAIVYSDRRIEKIDIDFPTSQFNHMILFIPLENDSLWVDPTSSFKCGYISSNIQNRYALVLDSDSSFLKKIPPISTEKVKQTKYIHIKSSPGSLTNLKIHQVFRGDNYENLFIIKQQFDKNKRIDILRDFFIDDLVEIPDEIVIQTSIENDEISFDYTTTSKTIVQHMGKEMMVNLPEIDLPDFEKPSYRKFDVQIDYPLYFVDEIVFEKPKTHRVSYLPKPFKAVEDYGEYSVKIEESENEIRILKIFLLKKCHIPINKYEEFYNFLNSINKIDRKLFIVATQ